MRLYTLAPLLMVAALTAPVQAATLAGHFQNGASLNRAVAAAPAAGDPLGDCATYKGFLDNAEREADRASGTPAAAKWSKLADQFWHDGVAMECGWAQ